MSFERIIEALIKLGLSRADAEVYSYIAKTGKQEVAELANALSCSKKQIYFNLRNLKNNGLVVKDGAFFSALQFEKALNLLITMKKKQTQFKCATLEELLSSWRSITENDDEKS